MKRTKNFPRLMGVIYIYKNLWRNTFLACYTHNGRQADLEDA